ncbi:DNA-methyltransferase [Streptomyces sp. NPDC058459]|uniref:DNA-methyltransferase n=1 Tax=Streptomyces sp. NPDC058459 TaxID=3346508 RepID=UPI003651DE9A
MSYTLHRGDALTVLKTLPDESVNAVITDPPYNSGGRTSSDRTGRTARAKYVTSGSAHDLQNFPGENRDQRSYRSWLTTLLTEAYRAATEHSVAMVFSDWRQEPTTSDALQMAGWTWSGTIPWIKPASRPRKGGFKQSAEFITWGVKGSLEKDRDLYLPGHFIASQPRKDRVHITQKPVEIMQQLVQIYSVTLVQVTYQSRGAPREPSGGRPVAKRANGVQRRWPGTTMGVGVRQSGRCSVPTRRRSASQPGGHRQPHQGARL